MKHTAPLSYYKIAPNRREWLGERYFRFDPINDECLQICFGGGSEFRSKGKGHNIGIYFISKLTFFSNYMAMNYAVPISKEKFEKQLVRILQVIK